MKLIIILSLYTSILYFHCATVGIPTQKCYCAISSISQTSVVWVTCILRSKAVPVFQSSIPVQCSSPVIPDSQFDMHDMLQVMFTHYYNFCMQIARSPSFSAFFGGDAKESWEAWGRGYMQTCATFVVYNIVFPPVRNINVMAYLRKA